MPTTIIHAVPGDDIVPQKPSLDDGDFWGGSVLRGVGLAIAATVLPAATVFAADDDLPTPPAATIIDEDYALVSVPPSLNLYVQPFLDDDQFVQQPAAATLAEEDSWAQPAAWQASASTALFSEADELPVTVVAAPIADEDFWVHPPPSAPWLAITFSDTDVIVPQPAPGQPDEDLWMLGPPPAAASIYMRLPYLPDPEEIPAGSLVPPTPPATRVFAIFVFDD